LLKSWKTQRFESPTANEFSKQQITTSILIGVFCLVLAVVLSYFGARTLLAPIKLVINSVEDLSNGNYTRTLINKRKDEFGELINNVNHLGEILEQTRSAKNRWFADISHELRTPLTVLMGELEALKAGVRPLTMVHIDSLNQEAQLLKRLIDDLYQLSTVNCQHLILVPCVMNLQK
jgi:two-component system sensor histidine kinase BaeS